MNNVYMFVIVSFLILIVIIGVVSSFCVKNTKDWIAAGHNLGIIPSVGTYFATIISSSSVISYVGYYYMNGWGGWWNCAGTAVTTILSTLFFAEKLNRIGKITLPEYLEERFCRMEGIAGAVLILFSTIFLLCAQIIGGALILQAASGWHYVMCVVIISTLFILLTVVGGMYSVAWTDTLCAIVMLLGVWIMAIVLVNKNGGFFHMQQTLYSIDPVYLDPTSLGYPMIISWIFTWGVGNLGAPHFISRFFAAKDGRTVRISQGWCGILFFLFFLALILIGLSGIVLCPGIEQQDQVTTTLIKCSMPPLFGGVMLAAIIASAISTADSLLLLSATTMSHDIYQRYINKNVSQKKLLKLSRITAILIGSLAMLSSLLINDAIMWIQTKMITLMGAAMAPSVIFGLAWKRANRYGGIASFFCGLFTAIIWYALDQPFGMMPMLPSFIIGSVAMVGVSLGVRHSISKK